MDIMAHQFQLGLGVRISVRVCPGKPLESAETQNCYLLNIKVTFKGVNLNTVMV